MAEKARLYNVYNTEIKEKMMSTFGYKNIFQVPKIEKIVLSSGSKKEGVDEAAKHLTTVACQKSVITKSKKSIAQFGIREGAEVGAKVTMRNKDVMYNFLDRLVNIALLRWRSFEGIKMKSFNKQKKNISISLGIPDTRYFHEIKSETMKNRGFDVTICTNSRNVEEVKFLLSELGLPFKG